MLNKDIKIFVAGHRGMVGSAIWKNLKSEGYNNLVGKSRKELDLRNKNDLRDFFSLEKPKVVINSAAKVGGILANNNYPYKFLMENMQIQNNIIDCAFNHNVEKFIFLGSSCIYPKLSTQPIKEEYLLSGSLEPTNQWYALAKITGLKACEAIKSKYGKDFISLMPTNLYGPNDNFDLETSHVLPAMIRKFHDAKSRNDNSVNLWGSGKPLREFLFVEDLADAVLFCLKNNLEDSIYNVGTGKDLTIRELAKKIKDIVGYSGKIIWDLKKPDGTPRKLLDINKLKSLGWSYKTDLSKGIKITYEWFLENKNSYKELKL